jgi:hypothetical protein
MRDLSLPKQADGAIINPGAIIAPSPEIWGMSPQLNVKAHGSRGENGEDYRTYRQLCNTGPVAGC